MARGKSTSWETSKPLSHRARALIERDPEAVAEIVSRAKPGRAAVTGVFLSKRSAAKAAVMTALSGQTFPVRRGKAAVVKSTKKPVRTGRNADVVNIDAVPLSDPEPIPERLRRFLTAPDGVDAFVSATEAARRLGIARGTVYAWIDEGLLLGWRQTGQGLFIPAEQIRGARDVVPGLAELGEIIGDPRLLWSFLSRPQPFATEVRRPIELLAEGRVEEVAGAALAFGASPS